MSVGLVCLQGTFLPCLFICFVAFLLFRTLLAKMLYAPGPIIHRHPGRTFRQRGGCRLFRALFLLLPDQALQDSKSFEWPFRMVRYR